MSKWTSRKFILALAAFVASLGTSMVGLFNQIPAAVVVGNICTMLSAAIYAGAEAYVDAAAVDKDVEIIEEEEEDDQ